MNKKYNKLFLAGSCALSMIAMSSCVGDLDLKPTDPSLLTPDQFASNTEAYLKQAISGVYLQYSTYGANGSSSVQNFDGGMSTFQRAMFILEEVPSDEASWIPNDADYGQFQYGIVPTNNTVVMGTYSRLFINIAMCNQFIQTVKAGYFNITTDEQQKIVDKYIMQARILRAGAYWYAIDNFGNVPYADENVDMGVVAPQLSSNFAEGRRLVYQKVVADLEDIVAWYKENDPNNKPEYGYVGLDVAEALLVKFYLNAEVYTGTAAWDKCYDHAEAIIARLGKGGEGHGLCKEYFQNFSADNAKYAIGGASDVNEIIWTIPQAQTDDQGHGLLSWANSTFMCDAWIGTSSDDQPFNINVNEFNAGDGWKCILARPQFVEKFAWDASFSVSPDHRTSFWKTAKDGFKMENTVLSQSEWGQNGYLAVKYTNWSFNDDGSINVDASPAPTKQLGGDYAMIRLAEIYLSAAEAALHGGGDKAKALEYVNYIRERAKMPTYNAIDLGELENERCRELYTECIRRSDLVRYGKWISGYTWSWKNNEPNGHDFAPNFTVYPLPSSTCARNGYTQNPNY